MISGANALNSEQWLQPDLNSVTSEELNDFVETMVTEEENRMKLENTSMRRRILIENIVKKYLFELEKKYKEEVKNNFIAGAKVCIISGVIFGVAAIFFPPLAALPIASVISLGGTGTASIAFDAFMKENAEIEDLIRISVKDVNNQKELNSALSKINNNRLITDYLKSCLSDTSYPARIRIIFDDVNIF